MMIVMMMMGMMMMMMMIYNDNDDNNNTSNLNIIFSLSFSSDKDTKSGISNSIITELKSFLISGSDDYDDYGGDAEIMMDDDDYCLSTSYILILSRLFYPHCYRGYFQQQQQQQQQQQCFHDDSYK